MLLLVILHQAVWGCSVVVGAPGLYCGQDTAPVAVVQYYHTGGCKQKTRESGSKSAAMETN